MDTCLCEEMPKCTNFQSAICLHCNRRLCLLHITEHNQFVLNQYQQLTNEIEEVSQYINNEYEKTRGVYQTILSDVNNWRAKQLEKIGEIYESHLQYVESRQEALNNTHQQLSELLDREARQPLKTTTGQGTITPGLWSHVQEIIKRVQNDSTQLKWNSLMSAPLNREYLPMDSSPKQVSSSSDKVRQQKPSSYTLGSLRQVNLRRFRPFKRLVSMFRKVRNVEHSKSEIVSYLERQNPKMPIPNIIASFLVAWNRTNNANEKNVILKDYVSVIRNYISFSPNDFSVLVGIHAFFYNTQIEECKRELMTMILQFFVDNNCLNVNQVIYWFKNKDENAYKGFDGAKQMTAPFIKSLWMNRTDNNQQAAVVQTNVEEREKKPFESL
ncbi:unnamed protein product [Adineta ricciae]|uniref:Uncharacterized protein n=1 Tax=Adineta ricciae TaxID=249248 RepID=A0A814QKE2_ADIRI|nr:unnamed protein product [Adineta ricciae]